jgi:hypothetical protein
VASGEEFVMTSLPVRPLPPTMRTRLEADMLSKGVPGEIRYLLGAIIRSLSLLSGLL